MIRSLSKRKKIINLIRNGKKYENEFFKVYILENIENKKPELFIANISKKSLKKSYLRNLYKRRIKAVFYNKIRHILKQGEILIMPKIAINTLKTYKEIESNLISLFSNMV